MIQNLFKSIEKIIKLTSSILNIIKLSLIIHQNTNLHLKLNIIMYLVELILSFGKFYNLDYSEMLSIKPSMLLV